MRRLLGPKAASLRIDAFIGERDMYCTRYGGSEDEGARRKGNAKAPEGPSSQRAWKQSQSGKHGHEPMTLSPLQKVIISYQSIRAGSVGQSLWNLK